MRPLLQPSHRKTFSPRQANHLHRCSATSTLPVPLSCSSLVGRKGHTLFILTPSSGYCRRTDMRLEEHFESSSTLQRNERVKLAASFWNNVGAGMVIGGMAAAFFLDKPSGVWTKIGIAIAGLVLGWLCYSIASNLLTYLHSTRSAALGQRAILPTEYSAAVYTGTNNDPAHMKKGASGRKGRATNSERVLATPASCRKFLLSEGSCSLAMTRQSCTPSARDASLGLLCRERQADSDHGCHQWHWLGGGRGARRTRREPRHRRSQQDQDAHCVGSHQGGGREGNDGGDIHRRPLVAGLGAQIGRRGAGPLCKAGCAHQQRRRDVRNTAADEGRHRNDLGGQPSGAVSAQQAPPPPAEGKRAGPHHHHGIPGASGSTHPVRRSQRRALLSGLWPLLRNQAGQHPVHD